MRTGLMTKLFAGLVVVLVAVVAAQFASSATSRSTKSIPARVRALETKLRSLTASINTLKDQVATMQTHANCLGAQGVVQWGNPAAGQGYVYTNDGGVTAGLTTAFDAPAQGQTPAARCPHPPPAVRNGGSSETRGLARVLTVGSCWRQHSGTIRFLGAAIATTTSKCPVSRCSFRSLTATASTT